MMVEYLQQILNEHDCVILPGFGGFIAQYKPAVVDLGSKYILPPCKTIAFNLSLQKNDGLLVSKVAESEKISYKMAEISVKQFTEQVKTGLQLNNSFIFEGIGRLYMDENKIIQFQPSREINLSGEMFGLEKVEITPVNRLKESLAASLDVPAKVEVLSIYNPLSKKKFKMWPFRTAAVLAGIFLASSSIINIYSLKNNGLQQKASFFPAFNASTETVIEEPISPTIETPVLENISDAQPTAEGGVASDETPPTTYSNGVIPDLTDRTAKEVVVVGSFKTAKKAQKVQQEVAATGYNAYVAGKGKTYRICIAVDKTTLEESLSKIRSEVAPDAWVLK